jgi:DNA-nicking Smr family endonuclease
MAKLGDLKALLDAKRAQSPVVSKAAAAKASPAAPALSPVRPSPVSARKSVAATKHAGEDIALERAFADVERLRPVNRAKIERPPTAPVPRQSIADERDALEASKYGLDPAPQAWDIGQEVESEQTWLRSGLGPDVLTKLRRGHWAVQAVVDLHGATQDEAHDQLADFLAAARGAGMRCVRVIHGKGLSSPNREPVLKGKVRRWLTRWDDVLAYCEAPQHAGGGGAVVVLLRGR